MATREKEVNYKFWLRPQKRLKDGRVPLYLVYTVHGKRRSFYTKINIFEEQWSQTDGMIIDDFDVLQISEKYKLKIAKRAFANSVTADNTRLTKITEAIDFIENDFKIEKKVSFTSEMVISRLIKLLDETPKDETKSILGIGDFIEKFLSDNEQRKQRTSLTVYKSLNRRLAEFEKKKHLRTRLTFEDFDRNKFDDFSAFLTDTCQYNNTTRAKILITLKSIFNLAYLDGHRVNVNYKSFKVKRPDLKIVALNQSEFEKIYNFDFSYNKRLEHVRDVFIFSCVTGLRFSDISHLNHAQIKEDVIEQHVEKTSLVHYLPLNKYSREILAKYKQDPTPLPVISNQKSNKYLHELCQIAGVDDMVEVVTQHGEKKSVKAVPKYELITMHVGRKTFCTLSLRKGMSIVETMSVSGHKDYRSFARYVAVEDEEKKRAMKKAWD